MPADIQAFFTQLYSRFNTRDLDTVLEKLQPDVDWPSSTEGGRVQGRQAVREYWLRQWTTLDPHVDPVSIVALEANKVSVTVHQVVKDLSGKLLSDQTVEHLYTLRDGLVERMEIQ